LRDHGAPARVRAHGDLRQHAHPLHHRGDPVVLRGATYPRMGGDGRRRADQGADRARHPVAGADPPRARDRHRAAPAASVARRRAGAREALVLASWVIVPRVLFTLNQSKLPQYVLPLMPAIALAATRNIVVSAGGGSAWRVYTAIAVVAGIALVALTRWLPAPIDLTPAEKVAIPPTALALGIALFASAILVAVGAQRRRREVVVAGYALVVI